MFDAGRRSEAVRIAQAARILFHDTKQSKSLVRTLLNRPDIKLRSTVPLSQPGLPNYQPLGFLGLEANTGHFRPFLDNTSRSVEVPLGDWWSAEPILRSLDGIAVAITRRELVLEAANTDGGAHVDLARSLKYQLLMRGFGLSVGVGWRSGVKATVIFRDAHLAALRQIGHEIITSPELGALAAGATSG